MRFFPRLWFGNPQIRVLGREQRAVLVELHALAAERSDRRLPNDRRQLAQLLGVTQARINRWLVELREFYVEVNETEMELRPFDAIEFDPRQSE